MASFSDTQMQRLDAFIVRFGETWDVEGGNLRTRNAVGDAVIHLLAECNEADLIEVAICQGELPDARGEFDLTPLHHAANNLAFAAIEKLVSLGADPELRDNTGQTPGSLIPRGLDVPEHIRNLLGVARKRRTLTRLKDKR